MNVYGEVQAALKNGTLVRPDRCSECDKDTKLHAHHDNYDEPLEVRWLCPLCHRRWHSKNGAAPGERELAFSFKIERDKLDALREVAEKNHRSVSQEVRWLIDRRLNEREKAA